MYLICLGASPSLEGGLIGRDAAHVVGHQREALGASRENAFSFTTQNGASSGIEASTKRFRSLPAALRF